MWGGKILGLNLSYLENSNIAKYNNKTKVISANLLDLDFDLDLDF